MTLLRLAFLFGLLELGFVVASFSGQRLYLLVSAWACLALCAPYVRERILDGRAGRPKTAPGKE